MGLTSRKLRTRVCEHVKMLSLTDESTLKPIPRHFRQFHDCNATLLEVRGIDRLNLDGRGGDLKQKLAELEARWITRIVCLQPNAVN